MRHFLLFSLLLFSWIILSSTTLESVLIGVVVSGILCIFIKIAPSPLIYSFIFYSYLKKIFRSVLEAFELLFNLLSPKKELFRRIVDISFKDSNEVKLAVDMLTITLTPKTIAFDSLEDTIFVHEVFFKND